MALPPAACRVHRPRAAALALKSQVVLKSEVVLAQLRRQDRPRRGVLRGRPLDTILQGAALRVRWLYLPVRIPNTDGSTFQCVSQIPMRGALSLHRWLHAIQGDMARG